MKTELRIVTEPIDESAVRATRQVPPTAGALVHFLGLVRGDENGQPIIALHYETFQQMAEHQFQIIFKEVESRWPIDSIRVIHRVGRVAVNEPSLLVEVVAPHRAEAFAAAQYLIDRMKEVVPIWKRTEA